jgi:hypothetical protein
MWRERRKEGASPRTSWIVIEEVSSLYPVTVRGVSWMIDFPSELVGYGDLAESLHGFSALLCRGGEGGDDRLLWTKQQAVASLTINSKLGYGFD